MNDRSEEVYQLRGDQLDRILEFVGRRERYWARADYAEWMAKQCRKIADEHPLSTEAEALQMVARFATRDAERFRELRIDLEVEWELRHSDLDGLAERLTQK